MRSKAELDKALSVPAMDQWIDHKGILLTHHCFAIGMSFDELKAYYSCEEINAGTLVDIKRRCLNRIANGQADFRLYDQKHDLEIYPIFNGEGHKGPGFHGTDNWNEPMAMQASRALWSIVRVAGGSIDDLRNIKDEIGFDNYDFVVMAY